MSEVKICKDCKFCKIIQKDYYKSFTSYVCENDLDIVSGEKITNDCYKVRNSTFPFDCGIDAKYFEPKGE